jgi:hypothetical protein
MSFLGTPARKDWYSFLMFYAITLGSYRTSELIYTSLN